jgi:hypothetical protein
MLHKRRGYNLEKPNKFVGEFKYGNWFILDISYLTADIGCMENQLLTKKRGVTSDWYFDQATALLEFALQHDSATALVYAALEARNGLERFVVEMSLLATGGHLSEAQICTAQRKDGAFQLLDQAMNNYRRHLQFTNLTLEICGDPFRVVIPDIKQFRRLRTDLSDYCHFQLNPTDTVDHPQNSWFIKGATQVQKALDMLRNLYSQVNAVIWPDSMPAEVREVFRAFVAGQIDTPTARLRLRLMQPVLEERLQNEFL